MEAWYGGGRLGKDASVAVKIAVGLVVAGALVGIVIGIVALVAGPGKSSGGVTYGGAGSSSSSSSGSATIYQLPAAPPPPATPGNVTAWSAGTGSWTSAPLVQGGQQLAFVGVPSGEMVATYMPLGATSCSSAGSEPGTAFVAPSAVLLPSHSLTAWQCTPYDDLHIVVQPPPGMDPRGGMAVMYWDAQRGAYVQE